MSAKLTLWSLWKEREDGRGIEPRELKPSFSSFHHLLPFLFALEPIKGRPTSLGHRIISVLWVNLTDRTCISSFIAQPSLHFPPPSSASSPSASRKRARASVSPANNDPRPMRYHPNFPKTAQSDVVLVSSDGMPFATRKICLAASSPVFEDTLLVGEEGDSADKYDAPLIGRYIAGHVFPALLRVVEALKDGRKG